MKQIHFLGLMGALVFLSGCAATVPVERAKYAVSDFETPGATRPLKIEDPIEPINRGTYRFNYNFDRFVFLPVVKSYEFLMPNYLEDRVSNAFQNIGEIVNFSNSALQLKPRSTGITLSRFAINSTVGIAGLWDPASHLNLPRQDEDFGQTLGHYGVGNGPYIVLPVAGPSNLRDATGLATDALMFTAIDPLNFDHHDAWEVPFYVSSAIDERHRQAFRYYKSGSPFEYEFVRLIKTEMRKLQIAK